MGRSDMDAHLLNATGVGNETNRIGGGGTGGNTGPVTSTSIPGGNSEREPPDPIPNSEVKTLCADGSVPFRHARVGHCQALKCWKAPQAYFHNRRTAPAGKPAGAFSLRVDPGARFYDAAAAHIADRGTGEPELSDTASPPPLEEAATQTPAVPEGAEAPAATD